jgi:hypothetical protein
VERFFKDSKAIQRFRSGPLAPQIQELAEELARDGCADKNTNRRSFLTIAQKASHSFERNHARARPSLHGPSRLQDERRPRDSGPIAANPRNKRSYCWT